MMQEVVLILWLLCMAYGMGTMEGGLLLGDVWTRLLWWE